MLREIIGVWKHHQFMGKVVHEFGQMLKDDEYVFSNAWNAIDGQVQTEAVKQLIHEKDKSVNKREREIRRMLMEHLSINPGQDVSGCLVMMSLVKDAERIGDYSKNIFDLAVVLKQDAKQMKYFGKLVSIHDKLEAQIGQLEKAFLDGNQDISQAILKEYAPIKDSCSRILNDLFTETLSTKEARTSVISHQAWFIRLIR